MKKRMWAVSFLALIGTVIVLPFMPERIPLHYDMAGSVDRWGSRFEMLIFPLIVLLLSLFMALLIGYFDRKALATTEERERAGARSNAKVLGIAGLTTALLFAVIQAFFLYGSYRVAVSGAQRQTEEIGKISVLLTGLALIVLGNCLTKTRSNRAVGVRTRWSMYNENTWRKSNRFGAFALILAGILTSLLAVLLDSSFGAATAMLGIAATAAIVTVIYSYQVLKLPT